MVVKLNKWWCKRFAYCTLPALIALLGALIYLVSPIDAVPDILVPIGYIDDAGIIAFVFNLVQQDIQKYKDNKNKQKFGLIRT